MGAFTCDSFSKIVRANSEREKVLSTIECQFRSLETLGMGEGVVWLSFLGVGVEKKITSRNTLSPGVIAVVLQVK